ncbi:hypothetical protein [Streptomyces sp. NPDC020298]|uniref:hypothetical protein n=1 Tax=unclassified Streptomyces TaxID=2593676 RepID=UPI0033D7F5EF
MNRIRLNLHRLFRRSAVTGPYRIYVHRTPTGVMLDVEHYLISVIKSIADDPELLDLLLEVAEDRGLARGHDGWEPERLLVEKLTAELGYELPVYGGELTKMAQRLSVLDYVVNGAAIPAQREAGAA